MTELQGVELLARIDDVLTQLAIVQAWLTTAMVLLAVTSIASVAHWLRSLMP